MEIGLLVHYVHRFIFIGTWLINISANISNFIIACQSFLLEYWWDETTKEGICFVFFWWIFLLWGCFTNHSRNWIGQRPFTWMIFSLFFMFFVWTWTYRIPFWFLSFWFKFGLWLRYFNVVFLISILFFNLLMFAKLFRLNFISWLLRFLLLFRNHQFIFIGSLILLNIWRFFFLISMILYFKHRFSGFKTYGWNFLSFVFIRISFVHGLLSGLVNWRWFRSRTWRIFRVLRLRYDLSWFFDWWWYWFPVFWLFFHGLNSVLFNVENFQFLFNFLCMNFEDIPSFSS